MLKNIQRISWPARKPFRLVGDKANGRRLKGFQSAYSRPSRLGLGSEQERPRLNFKKHTMQIALFLKTESCRD